MNLLILSQVLWFIQSLIDYKNGVSNAKALFSIAMILVIYVIVCNEFINDNMNMALFIACSVCFFTSISNVLLAMRK